MLNLSCLNYLQGIEKYVKIYHSYKKGYLEMKKVLYVSLSVMMLLSMASTSYSRGKRTNSYARSRVSATNVFTNEVEKKQMGCGDALLYCYTQQDCEAQGGLWQTKWTKTNPNDSSNPTETITEWVNPQGKTIYGMCFPKNVNGVEQEDTEHVCSAETPIYCGTEEACVNVGLVWSDVIPSSKCQTRQALCEANGAGTWINGQCSCGVNFVFSEEEHICKEAAEVFYCTDQRSEALMSINNTISNLQEILWYKKEVADVKKDYKDMDKKAKTMQATAIISGTTAVAATTWATISVTKNIAIKKCLCSSDYRNKKKPKCDRLLSTAHAEWDENGILSKWNGKDVTSSMLQTMCKKKYTNKSSKTSKASQKTKAPEEKKEKTSKVKDPKEKKGLFSGKRKSKEETSKDNSKNLDKDIFEQNQQFEEELMKDLNMDYPI